MDNRYIVDSMQERPEDNRTRQLARQRNLRRNAPKVAPFAFILSFGVVSMFMDVVYEAALSVQGPLLLSLGASALIVGVVSGLGEATALVGRLFSGPLADKTGRYWTFAILGYAATAVAVPAMGFAGSVVGVSVLVVFERFGKSLRTPSRDAMLSHASVAVGRGKGFAIHEMMDQIGAISGPLIVAAVLSATGNDYRMALGFMVIPGAIAIAILLTLRWKAPKPELYEEQSGQAAKLDDATASAASKRPTLKQLAKSLPKKYWMYSLACGTVLAGVATFGILSYHMVNTGFIAEAFVPVLYAVAMALDAVFALITGMLYDRVGSKALRVLPVVCACIPVFAYMDSLAGILAGVVLWGASLGIQESTMRAAIGDMVPSHSRASAYGMFSVFVGVGGLVGGVVSGALYTVCVPALIVYAICVEIAAMALIFHCTQ